MEEDSRFAGWATEKKATPPSQAALDEKKGESAQEEPPATVVPAAQPFTIGKGGMLIQPIFAGEERKQPEGGAAASAGKEASEPAQEERIRKIQRIIDELSPDKYKAASLPQKEAAVAEKPSYKKPHSPSRSIEVNEEAPGANEGASGKEGPEKEETPAEEGQPQAPGKKKQQVPAAKKPAQAPVPEEDGMPALQEEKLAKATPVSRAAVQKKVGAAREEELPAEDGGSSAQGEEPLQQDEPQEEIAHAKKAPGARSARVLPKKTAIAKAAAVKRKKPAAEDEDASAQLADTEDEEPPDEPAPSAAQSRVAAGKQAASKKQAAAKAQPAAMERTAKAQPAAIERTAKSQTDSKKQLASGQQSEEPPEEPAPSAAKSQVAAGKQAASKKQAAAKVQPATRKQPVMQPSAKLLPAEKKQAVRAAGKPAQEPAPDDEQPAVQAAAKQSSAPRKLPVAAKAQPEARMHAPAKATAAAKKQAPAREEKPDEPEQETSQFPRTLVQKPVPKQSSLQSAGARQPQVPPYAKDTSAVPTSSERQRILPGGVSVPSSTYAQTYVPPARPRTPPSLVREQQPSDSEPVSVKVPLGKPRMLPKKPVAIKEVEEKTPDELEQEKLSSMPLDSVRKKLAAEGQGAPSDSGQEQSDSGQDDGIPSPEGEEGKAPREGEKQKSALPARPFEQSSREISGEAALPENNEDDSLSVPAPPPDEKPPEPAPGDYSDAKEQLRRKIAEEGLKRGITAESEEMLEQYAKENLIWLYEIYKMGGMSREDFLDKVREQSHNGQPGGADGNQQEQPANPALENLNRELEKKMKK